MTCEGYYLHLVWVDPETGNYVPHQRRSYPCHLTWEGHPKWTLEEVDHLIRHCEYEDDGNCRCRLHRGLTPFIAFPQSSDDAKPVRVEEHRMSEESPQLPRAIHLNDLDFQIITFGTAQELRSEDSMKNVLISSPEDHSPETPMLSTLEAIQTDPSVDDQEDEQQKCLNSSHQHQRETNLSLSLISNPTRPWNVYARYEENRLFHHFISTISQGMIPVDDKSNPWKTVYPILAMQNTCSSGSQALYHALLSKSAFHLTNLKGEQCGVKDKALAIRHYGIALQHLRQSLDSPSEDYTTVLAALCTVLSAGHVFQGAVSGWQSHIRGAVGFIKQYLYLQPWRKSHDAYIVTQSFALSVLISGTVDNKFLLPSTADGMDEVDDLLHDLMAKPVFGYTVGGTPHILKAIHKVRLLEARINMRDSDNDPSDPDSDIFSQVGEILQLTYMPLSDKVGAYIGHRELAGMVVPPQMRMLTRLHLRLFNTAVTIYLFCVVLRCPPSSVAKDVLQVLKDSAAFIYMHGGSISTWPVFVAAVEAYTPESQTIATHVLSSLQALGVGNRRDIVYIIHEIWSDRKRLARERQCDPGEVLIDWRQVMKRLNMETLLL